MDQIAAHLGTDWESGTEVEKLQICHEILSGSLDTWENVRDPPQLQIDAYILLYPDQESGRIL